MSRNVWTAFIVCISACVVFAQREPLTNSDIVNMVKSGLNEQTIVLGIQQSPAAFDTSPDALIKLKKQGVPDAVLNAMLKAPNQGRGPAVVKVVAAENDPRAVNALLESVLRYYGGKERVQSVKATQWKGTVVETTSTERIETQVSITVVLPGSVYLERRAPNGQVSRTVVTSDGGYITTGSGAPVQMPADTLASSRRSLATEPLVILSTLDGRSYQPSIAGSEQIENIRATILKFTVDGQEVRWSVDPASGRILRTVPSAEAAVEYFDWRNVDGLNVPYVRRAISKGRVSQVTITDYSVNPVIDRNITDLFRMPTAQTGSPSGPVGSPELVTVVKAIAYKSLPYYSKTVYQISPGSSNTTCNGTTYGHIDATAQPNYSGGANISGTMNSDTTTNCNTTYQPPQQGEMNWRTIYNYNVVEGGGYRFVILCTASVRWSKCVYLVPGGSFAAEVKGSQMWITAYKNGNQKKPERVKYDILQVAPTQ